ncbi:Peptidoglycan/LPS O-acetylase OafA/YrhL, contains acyltransferase and SGNH-hydrolase domains [Pseudomonas sp. B10]|uniref:acyltransferase family protein n=1 Tax=Pseudomonas sp. B10 TaxID=118613 RepID=UPI0009538BFC|nr:acyltransferase family protein [Pseudomonas sp. B10]SIR84383.1 Peptidoglycan/LPS O-acetylase OafA/YrhL, contains acyltransferase and SGNH-hydrolase domains [Pseudomonas sp. B10]
MNVGQPEGSFTVSKKIHAPIHPKYRPDIDGLRAIAVLAVVGFHAFPSLIRGGFVGVDVFFVISGFLISSIIFGSLDRSSFSFAEFYGRRVRRIFPALITVLLVTLLAGWFLLFVDEYAQLGKHTAAGAGFISNLVLWGESGYFDNSAETKPLLHLWSLGIEEQFYIVWPILLVAIHKLRLNALWGLVTVACISFALNLIGVQTDQVATFYSPQTRFWELLVGAGLAYLTMYRPDLSEASNGSVARHSKSLLGAALVMTAVLLANKEKAFPGWWATLPVIGAALLISAGPHAWLNRVVLSNRLMVWIGLISFPLYLWHWPLLSFARIVQGGEPPLAMRVALVLASIVLAWATYALIERRVRHMRSLAPALVATMIVLGVTGYIIFASGGAPERAIAVKSADLQPANHVAGYRACTGTGLSDLDMCQEPIGVNPNIALVGDSHADDKFPGIVASDKQRSWILLANNSCPPVLGVSVVGSQPDCSRRMEAIFDWLQQRESVRVVVLSFFGGYFLPTKYAADHVKSGLGPGFVKISMDGGEGMSYADIFKAGLDNSITRLEESGKRVVLNVDTPELPWFPRDCLRNPLMNCTLKQADVLARQSELRLMLEALKTKHPQLEVYDPLGVFCTRDVCSISKEGILLYRDSHHLSERGSRIYAEDFLRILK